MAIIRGARSAKAFGQGGAIRSASSRVIDVAIPGNVETPALSLSVASALSTLQSGDFIEWEFSYTQAGTVAGFLILRPYIGAVAVAGSGLEQVYQSVAGGNKIIRGSMVCATDRTWRVMSQAISDPAGTGNDVLARYVVGVSASGASDNAVSLALNTQSAGVSISQLSGWIRATRP